MNKELTQKLAPGHATCAGCGIPAIVRTVLGATDDPVIVVNVTGCLEVTSTLYPYSAWKIPWIHSAFENGGATASGIAAAVKAFKKRNKFPKDLVDRIGAFLPLSAFFLLLLCAQVSKFLRRSFYL